MARLPRGFKKRRRFSWWLPAVVGLAAAAVWWWAAPFAQRIRLIDQETIGLIGTVIGIVSFVASTVLGILQLRKGDGARPGAGELALAEHLRPYGGAKGAIRRVSDREVRALALRVHAAMDLPDVASAGSAPEGGRLRRRLLLGWKKHSAALHRDLPMFVPRARWPEVCAWMGEAREKGGFLLLVGNSCVGKTRLLYEAARQELPDYLIIAPHLGDGELVNMLAESSAPLPPLLIWLDELQRFLDGPYLSAGSMPVTASAIQRLLDDPGPVVIVGTMWPEHATNLRATEPNPLGGQRLLYPNAVDVLGVRQIQEISVHTFNTAERQAAAALASRDPRLAEALADRDYNVTELLAGARELMSRYMRATSEQQAVLHAAIDAHRVGLLTPLSYRLLADSSRGYLPDLHPDNAWFDPALAELTRRDGPVDRATAPLVVVLDPDRTRVVGYTVADYLQQRIRRTRRGEVLPDAAWRALLDHTETPADLMRLADAADRRMLYGYAEAGYRRLIDSGVTAPAARLAELLGSQGRLEEAAGVLSVHQGENGSEAAADDALEHLHARANTGDGKAARKLADSLATEGQLDAAVEVLRTSAATGDTMSKRQLAELLARQDRIGELRAIAEGDEGPAARRLIDLLVRQGRVGELKAMAARDGSAARRLAGMSASAEEMAEWRARVGVGDWSAVGQLVDVLVVRGSVAEAIDLLERGARNDDWFCGGRLVELLFGQDLDERLRKMADEGDWFAARRLVELYAAQGRKEELRELAGRGDWSAGRRLSELLFEQGDVEGGVEALRYGATCGDWSAARRLAEFLAGHGRVDELRTAADAGDTSAARRLADLLAAEGRLDELRSRADAGDGPANARLVEALADRKLIEELQDRSDAGDWLAGGRLVELLVEENRLDELRLEVHAGTYLAGEQYVKLLSRTDSIAADRVRRRGLQSGVQG